MGFFHPCQRDAKEDVLITFVSIVAVILGFALFAYFLWEGAPCHSTPHTEKSYLIACLVAWMLVTMMFNRRPCYDDRAETAMSVVHLTMLVAAVHVYRQHIDSKPLPKYDSGASSEIREVPKQTHSRIVSRFVDHLEDLLQELFHDDRVLLLPPKALPILLLLLTTLQQLALNWKHISWALNMPVVSLQVLIVLLFLVRSVQSFLEQRPRHAKIEHLIEVLVEEGNRQLLSEVLHGINVPTLLLVSRIKVWRQLTCEALEDGLLDTFAKGLLINAIQKCGLNSWNQGLVRDLLVSSSGQELTQLKSMIDSTGDYNNLFKLVYVDIQDSKIRNAILQHLEVEAKHMRRAAHGAREGLKILSDIDDTLYCSGGVFPAGCDKRLPRGTVYPGCLQLFRELDRGRSSLANLVFLSARPHFYKDIAEQQTFEKLSILRQQGLHTQPSLLSGSLRISLLAVLKSLCCQSRPWQDVGKQKAAAFSQYVQLYQECDFIFFGDNGQGDLLAGQQMLAMERIEDETTSSSEEESIESDGHGSRLLAVMIHEVTPLEKSQPLDTESDLGIHLYGTYVGAAIAIHKALPDLLSAAQLLEVAHAAQDDLRAAQCQYPEWAADWAPFEAALRRDLKLTHEIVGDAIPEVLDDRQAASENAADPYQNFAERIGHLLFAEA